MACPRDCTLLPHLITKNPLLSPDCALSALAATKHVGVMGASAWLSNQYNLDRWEPLLWQQAKPLLTRGREAETVFPHHLRPQTRVLSGPDKHATPPPPHPPHPQLATIGSSCHLMPSRMPPGLQLFLEWLGIVQESEVRLCSSCPGTQLNVFYTRRQHVIAQPSQHLTHCCSSIIGRIQDDGAEFGTIDIPQLRVRGHMQPKLHLAGLCGFGFLGLVLGLGRIDRLKASQGRTKGKMRWGNGQLRGGRLEILESTGWRAYGAICYDGLRTSGMMCTNRRISDC